jgi:N-acetylmuramoyl-L-alanine amidase
VKCLAHFVMLKGSVTVRRASGSFPIMSAVFLTTVFTLSPTARSLTAAEPLRKAAFRVCLDPGHPSENNDGRELLNGVREVEINWAVTQALRKLLEEKGYAVVLTKSSLDEYVTNKRRAEIANETAADLMLRLHADSEGPSGFTVFCPHKQGLTNGVRGPSPTVIEASGRTAKVFHGAFVSELREQLKDNGIKGDEQTFIGGKQGALTGSIYSAVPVLLIEMCNLAKPADAQWISEPANQRAFAKALLAGVTAVADSKAP